MTTPPTPAAVRPDRRRFLALAGIGAAAAVVALAGCGDGSGVKGPTVGGETDPDPAGPVSPGSELGTTGRSGPNSSRPTGPGSTPPGGAAASTGTGQAGFVALRSPAARRSTGASASTAQEALGGFGADMFRAVADAGSNTVISPYSLYTVLAMARAGAKGRTATQLDGLLRAKGSEGQGGVVTAVDQAVAAARSATPVATPMSFDTANQTWVQSGFDVRQGYLDALAEQFGVQAVAADFAESPDAMRAAINDWVAERTAHLIKNLFPAGSIDDMTRLVLVNALHLKASWAEPFSALGTSEPFTTDDGRSVTTPMMISPQPVRGVIGDGWTSVTVPYAGGGVAMTVLVPDEGGYHTVLEALSASLMHRAGAQTAAVALRMPPFATRSAPDVLAAAQRLGVTDLFDSTTADLSGISGTADLYASAFVHQAVITVDEKGTEAAAATGMGMRETSAPMVDVELTVDRPFLYWIADTVTGAPLFLGTVTDPTAGN